MDRKRIVLILILLLVIGGLIFYWFKSGRGPLVSPLVKESEMETPKLTVWEDPAGFTFTYPEEIKIDPHDEDTENYAQLELTSDDHLGKILIWVKDTDYSEIEEWLEEEVDEEVPVLDTELGGEAAKKIAYTDPKKIVVAAIDVDALVLLEMYPGDEGYWQEVYDQILESFVYVPVEGEEVAAPADGGGGNIIYESEGVIE